MRQRTETYEHAIGGLLQKRTEMMEEMAITRERLAVLSNDIEALDRVLERLGYDGDIKLTPRVPRIVLFYRGELRQFLLNQLRESGPATSRVLAERLVQIEGKDARDRRMMADVVRRIGKALRLMQDSGLVKGTKTKSMGEYQWRLPERLV
jgi:chemotaxis protein histidine kinase CheA